jgi:hypothetical protein
MALAKGRGLKRCWQVPHLSQYGLKAGRANRAASQRKTVSVALPFAFHGVQPLLRKWGRAAIALSRWAVALANWAAAHLTSSEIVDSEAWASSVEVSSTSSKIARRALTLNAENDANDALDLPEPAIRRPVDVEHEPRGGELDQTEPEVSGISVGLVRLDVANATIIVLELALNIEIGARVVRTERDVEIQVIELFGRHVCRFELQIERLMATY